MPDKAGSCCSAPTVMGQAGSPLLCMRAPVSRDACIDFLKVMAVQMQVDISRRLGTAAAARMKPLGLQPTTLQPPGPPTVSNSATPAAAPEAAYPGQGKQNGAVPVPAGYSGNGKVKA